MKGKKGKQQAEGAFAENENAAYQQAAFEHPLGGQYRVWYPYVSPFDPCPPIVEKVYNTPPQLFFTYQPMHLPQFPPREALRRGTLWPALYSPYEKKST